MVWRGTETVLGLFLVGTLMQVAVQEWLGVGQAVRAAAFAIPFGTFVVIRGRAHDNVPVGAEHE